MEGLDSGTENVQEMNEALLLMELQEEASVDEPQNEYRLRCLIRSLEAEISHANGADGGDGEDDGGLEELLSMTTGSLAGDLIDSIDMDIFK